MSYAEELAFARTVALEAMVVAMEVYDAAAVDGKGLGIEHKTAGAGPVTEADRRVNELLVSRIARRFPADGILAEESEDDGRRMTSDRVWCIDPVDGTKEFIKRNGEFSIMIGLVDRAVGHPVVGVVCEPVVGRLLYASLGDGAYVQERDGSAVRLCVSDRSDASALRFIVSRSHMDAQTLTVRDELGVESVTPCGSVGLKCGRIGEDIADAYLNFGRRTSFWDTCGPEAILTEAGGKLTRFDGRRIDYLRQNPVNDYGILASNGSCHGLVLDACVRAMACS
jgi:3'(2'), 5'-bisphosphate nucleotidase